MTNNYFWHFVKTSVQAKLMFENFCCAFTAANFPNAFSMKSSHCSWQVKFICGLNKTLCSTSVSLKKIHYLPVNVALPSYLCIAPPMGTAESHGWVYSETTEQSTDLNVVSAVPRASWDPCCGSEFHPKRVTWIAFIHCNRIART